MQLVTVPRRLISSRLVYKRNNADFSERPHENLALRGDVHLLLLQGTCLTSRKYRFANLRQNCRGISESHAAHT